MPFIKTEGPMRLSPIVNDARSRAGWRVFGASGELGLMVRENNTVRVMVGDETHDIPAIVVYALLSPQGREFLTDPLVTPFLYRGITETRRKAAQDLAHKDQDHETRRAIVTKLIDSGIPEVEAWSLAREAQSNLELMVRYKK